MVCIYMLLLSFGLSINCVLLLRLYQEVSTLPVLSVFSGAATQLWSDELRRRRITKNKERKKSYVFSSWEQVDGFLIARQFFGWWRSFPELLVWPQPRSRTKVYQRERERERERERCLKCFFGEKWWWVSFGDGLNVDTFHKGHVFFLYDWLRSMQGTCFLPAQL